MNIPHCYSTLELAVDKEYTKQDLKKQFYKLSSRYHPDRFLDTEYTLTIKNKYINIIEAYNYLKSLEKDEITSNLPRDHTALKFINKINHKKTISKVIPENFNEQFLTRITSEDKTNLKLFFELGLSEQDIDAQFVLLHQDFSIVEANDLKLQEFIEKRELDIQSSIPKNILCRENLNKQFIQNKNRGMDVVKYGEPDNDKFYIINNGIDNMYKINDDIFLKEYDLPENPQSLYEIDKNPEYQDDTLNVETFNRRLDELIKERAGIYPESL